MAKYLIDFPMTIYATEIIEAASEEEAKEMAGRLLDSWEFFCERLKPDYQGCDLLWENCEEPRVTEASSWPKVTLDKEVIDSHIEEEE